MVIPSENEYVNKWQAEPSFCSHKKKLESDKNRVGVTLHKFQEWIRVSNNDRQEETGEEVSTKQKLY